ncbi:MAG: NTP transferase domain-containing protein [Elusimicrobiota bacterium]
MHVIVPMAGHSRRFQEKGYAPPKALLPIGGRPMIFSVLETFDTRADTFHVIANEAQVREHPELSGLLRSLAADVRLTVIARHELGPTYSALQASGIRDDEEAIVTYCDFTVDWDYALFLRSVKGRAGAIPAFRGFHPASLGETRYAYMRSENGLLRELREKKSFTADRAREFASTGTYYFGSWGLFRKYAAELLERRPDGFKEVYTSLLFNAMVRDGLDVAVTEVDRFVCWGTPEDYEHYLFWEKYFTNTEVSGEEAATPHQINLIPMAGQGSRFKAAGHRVTKPMISVRGRTMVEAAASSFPRSERWIFMPRAEDLREHPIEKALRAFAPGCAVIPVEGDTSGQAATCLLAKPLLDPSAPLFIASCDYQTVYDKERWRRLIDDASIDGVIWTFRLGSSLVRDPRSFAYCRLKPGGAAVDSVVEKETISADPFADPMAVGSFWYRRAADFVAGAETMIADGVKIGGEHYVGTSINCLIARGKRFVVFDVDQWISFGDPEELRVFEYWEDHFHERSRSGARRAR